MDWNTFCFTNRGERILNYGILEKNIEAFKIVRKPDGERDPSGTYLSCYRTNNRLGADIGHKTDKAYAEDFRGEICTYLRDHEISSSLGTTLGLACWENKENAVHVWRALNDLSDIRYIVRIEATAGTRYVRSTVNGQNTLWLEKLIVREEVL